MRGETPLVAWTLDLGPWTVVGTGGARGGSPAVTAAAFASKYRSKREVYTFLTLEVKAYMPPPHTLTICKCGYFF